MCQKVNEVLPTFCCLNLCQVKIFRIYFKEILKTPKNLDMELEDKYSLACFNLFTLKFTCDKHI